MKKSKFLVTLSSLFLLVGCGTVSFADAKTFVKENYSQDAVDQKYSGGKVETTTNYTKAEGIFSSIGTGKKTDTSDITPVALTEAGVAVYGDSATYKTSGKSLSVIYNMDAADYLKNVLGVTVDAKSLKGTAKIEYTYNSDGLISKANSKFDFSFNTGTSGISINGALAGTYSSKYTYTKK